MEELDSKGGQWLFVEKYSKYSTLESTYLFIGGTKLGKYRLGAVKFMARTPNYDWKTPLHMN